MLMQKCSAQRSAKASAHTNSLDSICLRCFYKKTPQINSLKFKLYYLSKNENESKWARFCYAFFGMLSPAHATTLLTSLLFALWGSVLDRWWCSSLLFPLRKRYNVLDDWDGDLFSLPAAVRETFWFG